MLLYFVFRKIPFREVAILWSKINIFYLFTAAFFFLISQILSTKRLEFYLFANQFNLNFQSNLELYFLGMFYNFFIPGGIGGDAYKVFLLNKNFGWNIKKITSSLFADRLSGLLAICILISVLFTFLIHSLWIWAIFVMIILGIFVAFFIFKKIFPTFKNIFFKTLIISIAIQISQVICFMLLLKSLGVENNYPVYAEVFLTSSVLSLISFSGIGVREMLFFQAAKYFSFMPSLSVSASLLFTVITIFFSFFGVIFQLRKLNLKLKT